MSPPPVLPIDEGLGASTVRVDVVLRIGWTNGEVSRLISAARGARLPADAVEDQDQALYSSFPTLTKLPALKQVVNGLASAVEFGVSGLPSRIAQLADEESHLAKGAVFNVGKVYWGRNWQQSGGTRWTWIGSGGRIRISRNGGSVSGGKVSAPTWSLSISAATDQIRRAGAEIAYWTDPQQQRLSPGDRICERTGFLSQGAVKAFPKF